MCGRRCSNNFSKGLCVYWFPDNFKLVDNGTSLHIETHSNPSVKIRVDSDTLTTGTSGVSEVFTSGGTTAVKIYFEETDGDRWYLRVNSDNNEAVEIVSESYVNNVSSHARLWLAVMQMWYSLK